MLGRSPGYLEGLVGAHALLCHQDALGPANKVTTLDRRLHVLIVTRTRQRHRCVSREHRTDRQRLIIERLNAQLGPLCLALVGSAKPLRTCPGPWRLFDSVPRPGRLDGSLWIGISGGRNQRAPNDWASAVTGDRRIRILAKLSDSGDGDVTAARLCDVCRDVTGMTGAGIMLMSGDLPLGSACTTGEVSDLVEDLQYSLGEGPCVDAHHQNRPVLEPDLANPSTPRWLAFSGPALGAGVRAIFGFPLVVGAVRLGALNLYADVPGPLSDEQHADALVLAAIAAKAVLAMQGPSRDGALAAELEEGSNFQYVVHQAAGMVSVQVEVSVADALLRLRGYAFANERTLRDVANAVVDRRLRFDDRDG
ncbi:MAG: GAF and ANTAR domain-containing protein [Actinomycetota bacterium]|nr:GAF and ANTAR domain-containing protein [Actinomycetota bacterium]